MTAYDRLITQAAVEEEWAEEQRLASIIARQLLEATKDEPFEYVEPVDLWAEFNRED